MTDCLWLRRYQDRVPEPFGGGTCSMETVECENERATDENIEACQFGPPRSRCPLYEPESDALAYQDKPEMEEP